MDVLLVLINGVPEQQITMPNLRPSHTIYLVLTFRPCVRFVRSVIFNVIYFIGFHFFAPWFSWNPFVDSASFLAEIASASDLPSYRNFFLPPICICATQVLFLDFQLTPVTPLLLFEYIDLLSMLSPRLTSLKFSILLSFLMWFMWSTSIPFGIGPLCITQTMA